MNKEINKLVKSKYIFIEEISLAISSKRGLRHALSQSRSGEDENSNTAACFMRLRAIH